MKEVKAGRFAGPFEHPLFENFVQSPIGLVPKGEDQTRLIFHLSYDFSDDRRSVNYYIPSELCSVRYNDLDKAVRNSLQLFKLFGKSPLWYRKTDLKLAFRILGLHPGVWWLLIMKAENPVDQKVYYFVDKCLPFGSSISCSHFQRFSNA